MTVETSNTPNSKLVNYTVIILTSGDIYCTTKVIVIPSCLHRLILVCDNRVSHVKIMLSLT